MILIADSGSTKTDWCLITSENNKIYTKTTGFNPYFQDSAAIYAEVSQKIVPKVNEKVNAIYFYGSGCSGEEKNDIVKTALYKAFPDTTIIEVNNDLLAAARALCWEERGIAAILGTGCNAGYYDGESIIFQPFSLGFWIGDEGSGSNLGKTLLVNYLRDELPSEILEKFNSQYEVTKHVVMDHFYKNSFPNRYCASFARFIADNISHPFIYKIAYDSISSFFDRILAKIPDFRTETIHFTGSIAFNFSDIVKTVAEERSMKIGKTLNSPIEGLVEFHLVNINTF